MKNPHIIKCPECGNSVRKPMLLRHMKEKHPEESIILENDIGLFYKIPDAETLEALPRNMKPSKAKLVLEQLKTELKAKSTVLEATAAIEKTKKANEAKVAPKEPKPE